MARCRVTGAPPGGVAQTGHREEVEAPFGVEGSDDDACGTGGDRAADVAFGDDELVLGVVETARAGPDQHVHLGAVGTCRLDGELEGRGRRGQPAEGEGRGELDAVGADFCGDPHSSGVLHGDFESERSGHPSIVPAAETASEKLDRLSK
jgi:hypothetical protein